MSFKEAFHIVESKEHLTEEGLDKLYSLSKSMNRGRKLYENIIVQISLKKKLIEITYL